jgi:ABC-type branched-subunit amino acid transport system substrate-binding protein
VLTYGDITGIGPIPQTQLQDGVQAAVDAFNAAGGVQGRKVELITCDTKLNPADAAGCVDKASAEGVVAAIPSDEVLDNITTPLLEKQGIPILGANPSTATAQYSKNTACFVPGAFVLYPQAATALAARGAKTLSFMQPTGVQNVATQAQAISAAAAESGATVKVFVSVAPTATNFSAIAAQASGGQVDGSYVAALPPGLFSIMTDVAQARPGIKLASPGFLAVNPQVTAALGKVPAAKGLYVNNYTAFPTDTSVPGIKLFQEQIAQLSKADAGAETALFTWLDGWGAMQIIGSIKSGAINPQTVLTAMKRTTVSFDGALPTWNYAYNTLGLGCVINNKIYEGQFEGGDSITPLNNGQPVTGISSNIVALYKKAFASYAR